MYNPSATRKQGHRHNHNHRRCCHRHSQITTSTITTRKENSPSTTTTTSPIITTSLPLAPSPLHPSAAQYSPAPLTPSLHSNEAGVVLPSHLAAHHDLRCAARLLNGETRSSGDNRSCRSPRVTPGAPTRNCSLVCNPPPPPPLPPPSPPPLPPPLSLYSFFSFNLFFPFIPGFLITSYIEFPRIFIYHKACIFFLSFFLF